MPWARSLVFFLVPFFILIPLSLLLPSTNLVGAILPANLHRLHAFEPLSPRQAHEQPSSATMLHYEKTPIMPSDHIAPSTSAPMPNSSSSAAAPVTAAIPQHRHIWIITGPAGCGKTSVAEYLSTAFALPYLEGDSVSVVHKLWSSMRLSCSPLLNPPCSFTHKPTLTKWPITSHSPTPTAGTG